MVELKQYERIPELVSAFQVPASMSIEGESYKKGDWAVSHPDDAVTRWTRYTEDEFYSNFRAVTQPHVCPGPCMQQHLRYGGQQLSPDWGKGLDQPLWFNAFERSSGMPGNLTAANSAERHFSRDIAKASAD